jgi:IS1 family transposase
MALVEVELDEMWSFVKKKSNQRLARETICFSKLEKMHDIVIGLFINRYEFGLNI